MFHPLEKFRFCPSCGSDAFIEANDKSKQCEKCGFQYYLNAVSAVACFVVDDCGRLLLCRRGKEPAKGSWDLPGGFVDLDESAEQALRREISEELGSEVESISYLFSLPNEYIYSGFTVRTLDMFFLIRLADLNCLRPADDVDAIEFFEFDKIDLATIGLKSVRQAVGRFLEEYKGGII